MFIHGDKLSKSARAIVIVSPAEFIRVSAGEFELVSHFAPITVAKTSPGSSPHTAPGFLVLRYFLM
jgi:hypothetical protein